MPTDHAQRLIRLRDPIATRPLVCVKPTGEGVTVSIKVGRPYVDGSSCRCPVAVEPLMERLPDIGGTDSWQALSLAMKLVRELLRLEVDQGSKLYWPAVNGESMEEYKIDWDNQ